MPGLVLCFLSVRLCTCLCCAFAGACAGACACACAHVSACLPGKMLSHYMRAPHRAHCVAVRRCTSARRPLSTPRVRPLGVFEAGKRQTSSAQTGGSPKQNAVISGTNSPQARPGPWNRLTNMSSHGRDHKSCGRRQNDCEKGSPCTRPCSRNRRTGVTVMAALVAVVLEATRANPWRFAEGQCPTLPCVADNAEPTLDTKCSIASGRFNKNNLNPENKSS